MPTIINNPLLVRASRLYYLDGKAQAEIAKILRISRPGVSRLLDRARREGIVEIRVRGDASGQGWGDLETRLGLKELIVAGGDGIEAVGEAAAAYFARTARKGDVIGLTAGTTLAAFVRRVALPRPLDIEIAPLVGALWGTGQDFDGSFLCQELRRRTGGRHLVLSAPAVVRDAAVARALRAEPRVRGVLERYRSVRCAFLGIGRVTETHPVVVAARTPGAKSRQGRSLVPSGAVASVGCLFFDREGRPLRASFEERTIGISHETLERIPVRAGLAAGADKADLVHALVRGGNLEVLITDPPLVRRLQRLVSSE